MNPCKCGHDYSQHLSQGEQPCNSCKKCKIPGHDPHVPDRCECSGYVPKDLDCAICGRPLVHGEICEQCQHVTNTKGLSA